jgi:hypothetical protein
MLMRDYIINWTGYVGTEGRLTEVKHTEKTTAPIAREALQNCVNSIIGKLQGYGGYAVADVNFNSTNESINVIEIQDIVKAINAEGGLQKDSFIEPLHYIKSGNRVDPVYASIRFEGRVKNEQLQYLVWDKRRVPAGSLVESLQYLRQAMIDEFKKKGNLYSLDNVVVSNIPITVHKDVLYDFFFEFNAEGKLLPLAQENPKTMMFETIEDGKKIFPVR